MFRILYMCVKGLFVASVRSSRACLTTGPLIVLLGFNYLLYRQSNRAAQRAQKYMTWKLVEDLDEDSLQKILGTLPAWIKTRYPVQFDDFERARFVNQALVGMWGYLDMAICTAIKHHVEPAIQDNLPFTISGFTFEKLGLGDAPFQIRGVKHASLFAGPGEPMALSVEVEAAWVTTPDIVAKLMPSSGFKLSHVDLRPSMYVKVDHLAVEGRLRLVFPLQLSLPIFNGLSISFLTTPKIDMSLKMLGGVDIMSMPALQEWATALISEQVSRVMTFPASIDISFTGDQVQQYAEEHKWPSGIATLELKTVHMPKWQTQACMPSVVLKPATWVDSAYACDVHAMTYPLVMDPQRPDTMEFWQAAFPVFDPGQLLQVIIVENQIGSQKGYPVTSVPIPLGPLFSKTHAADEQPAAEAARRPSRLPASSLGMDPLGSATSGPVLGCSRGSVGMHRAKSDSLLPHLATIGSESSSESEDTKPVVVAEDLEEVLRQSMPKVSPVHRNSFAEGEQRAVFRDSHTAPQLPSQLGRKRARPGSTRGSARSEAPSGAQTPVPGRAESTAAGQDEQDADSSSAHREGGSGKPPLRGGPWKGLASIFRRRPPPAPSPLAPADSAAYLQTQLEQLKGSRAAEQRAPRGVRTRAAATTNASTQPSMCSTPPSPFADDAGEPSLCSSPRSADAKPIPGPLPGDGAKEARCPSCNAQLPHTTDPALQAASVASHVATDQRRISGASETPSLREWSRGGLLPQLCNDCSRCAATALQQRTVRSSIDEDEQWAPWTSLQNSAFATQTPSSGRPSLQAATIAGTCSASISIPTPHTANTTRSTASASRQAGASCSRGNDVTQEGPPVASQSAPAHPTTPPFASAASSMGTSASTAVKLDVAQRAKQEPASDLDWDALWGGPRSAWDMAAMKRGIVTALPSTSLPTLVSPSTAASHMSTKPSQDGLSDLVGGGSLDTDHTEASQPSPPPAPVGSARHPQLPGSGPPLVARSRAQNMKCEVPIWLPDAHGTVAAMAPGGAYLMMRPLRQRSWYRHLDVRWQTDILQILPHSTVLDIKRCAAAVLAREAASAFSGPHPLLRSYNMHASLEGGAPTAHGRSGGSVAGVPHAELPRPRPHFGPAMVGGLLSSMLTSVVCAATAPLAAFSADQRHSLGVSHLPPDIQSESPVFMNTSGRPESTLRPHDVQLEANAGTGAVQFRGFAGAIKTHLQWLPLQWTYIVNGQKPPPVARSERFGTWLTTGVLVVRLLRTTVYNTKMQRPQVMLQLDQAAGKQELRRTGVRERWANRRASLHQGTVEWELKFSFSVEVEDAHELASSAQRGNERCLQVEVMEVEASLRDRMRAYWVPDADVAGLPEDEDVAMRDPASTASLGCVRVPLSKLVRTPNKPYQAVWQLGSPARDHAEDVRPVGNVTLETSWLPACNAGTQG